MVVRDVWSDHRYRGPDEFRARLSAGSQAAVVRLLDEPDWKALEPGES